MQREAATLRLGQIVAGGAAMLPGFVHLLKRIVPSVCEQVADLRSSLAKAGVQTVMLLCEALGYE